MESRRVGRAAAVWSWVCASVGRSLERYVTASRIPAWIQDRYELAFLVATAGATGASADSSRGCEKQAGDPRLDHAKGDGDHEGTGERNRPPMRGKRHGG